MDTDEYPDASSVAYTGVTGRNVLNIAHLLVFGVSQ